MATLLGSFDGFEVVLEAENGVELLEKLPGVEVDILLLDIEMPVMDGFETCNQLRRKFPKIKILIVSQLSTRESIYKTLQLGANGYFTKNSDPELLETAIRNIMDRDYHFDQGISYVMEQALKWQAAGESAAPVELTPREIQMVLLAAMGKSSQQIADTLFLSVRTVETHKGNIIDKTRCKNFIEVIFYALRHHYITLDMING